MPTATVRCEQIQADAAHSLQQLHSPQQTPGPDAVSYQGIKKGSGKRSSTPLIGQNPSLLTVSGAPHDVVRREAFLTELLKPPAGGGFIHRHGDGSLPNQDPRAIRQ